jgi:hypothetical protein
MTPRTVHWIDQTTVAAQNATAHSPSFFTADNIRLYNSISSHLPIGLE